MKYGELNLGQIEAIVNKLGGMDGALRLLRDELVVVERECSAPPAIQAVKPEPFLTLANNHVAWPAIENFDPQKYFKTRKGLWVSEKFRSCVLAKAGVITLGAAVGKSYDLRRNAYDREITAEMGAGYEFASESEICARIAQMIDRQPNGKEGDLLNNGRANLPYLPSCVVDVSWGAGEREWGVRAWERDDGRWLAGNRAFSCN